MRLIYPEFPPSVKASPDAPEVLPSRAQQSGLKEANGILLLN
jgi:hypothetical protein